MCLSLLSKCKTLKSVKQIQANFLKTGVDTDPFIAGKLILHCAVSISDALHYASRLLLHTPNPDAFMYNTLIRGLSESDEPQDSITTFIEMRRSSIAHLDSFSFAFVLKSAANIRSLRLGIQLHSQALVHGLDTHLFVATTLISLYAECGHIDSSRKVFDEMHEPNVVAWNALLTACFRSGEDVENAARVFDQMPLRNLTSWNVVLAGYTKAGELELARKTFVDMPMKDDVSWSTMIVGFAHSGYFEQALGFYKEMRKLGTRPNEVSLTGVLSVCAQAGAFEFGKIIHGFIEKAGFIWLVSVNNALVDAYSRCGNVSMAQLVFERMPANKDAISWTTMIAGLAMHGQAQEAIQLFHEMEESGNKPDGATFVSILYACSHAGLVDQGYQFFRRMKDEYNIEPAIEHYGCVVDMYGRAGKLKEAYEFVRQMPTSPNDIIWRTLLGACSIHGNLELAELVKERLSELDPNNSGDHVLLSNTYAISGKWKDVAAVRRSMTAQQIKKTPGWSMIEVGKILYSFAAGSRQNEIAEVAFAKLQEIMSRLRVEGGYVPEVQSVLHDIEEEEKEDSVSKHSEKLAVAFGMARLREGRRRLSIVKNLRVCSDCHTVMKLISKIYGLEIVVRDRSRFHSFTDGSCSCRDYW